jgi:4-diphosphocytidyl-2-C-methyl-D-erythritol kinase
MKYTLEANLSAFCKINLSLKITGRRPNGYHDVETVMAPIQLADNIKLRLAVDDGVQVLAPEITCKTEWAKEVKDRAFAHVEIPQDDSNLAVKAAKKFFGSSLYSTCARAGSVTAVNISISKSIPSGGGLGGGSADAAAVLRGLLQTTWGYYPEPKRQKELEELAAPLGADVPFLTRLETALCTGIGEKMERLPWQSQWGQYHLVMIHPGISVATPWAYGQWDERRLLTRPSHPDYADLKDVLARGENDFEQIVFKDHPKLAAIVHQCRTEGSTCARMTGSGSVLFAASETEPQAQQLFEKICQVFYQEIRNDQWYIWRTAALA